MTTVSGATALVTGGQQGLGKETVQELLRAGAAKVYVTSRTPVPADDLRIVPLGRRYRRARGPSGSARLRHARQDPRGRRSGSPVCDRGRLDAARRARIGRFAEASAPHRIWQDVNVGARHARINSGVGYEIYGKALLGVENDVSVAV